MRLRDLEIFGHRGAAGSAPENTLAGFERALAVGARWVELDVQAHPEALVIFHDDNLGRCTNGRGRVLDTPLSTLRALDAGGGQRIPLLQEVLERLRGRAGINVELKAGKAVGPRTAEVLLQALASGWRSESLVVSSFDHRALRDFQRLAPNIPVAPLFARGLRSAPAVARRLRTNTVHLGLRLASARALARLHACGLRTRVYTVNQLAVADRLACHGVGGIFTDYPERFAGRSDVLSQTGNRKKME